MTEKISKIQLTNSYVSTDLAVIIPTKDRPKEIKRLLKSITELDCKVGRIIIIASGIDIQNIVMSFINRIPVEYYYGDPGQIKQRNKGISLLDDSTKLVATMDDDVVFHKTSISEMINFWNRVEMKTAGVGFNIVNQVGHQHSWIRCFFGVSVLEPGKVMQSGFNTSISNIKESIRSEWLLGGATVWKQKILKSNPHHPINSSWAVCEDLIFSYPLSKKYHLYVCNYAKVNIEPNYTEITGSECIYRSKTEFLWSLYFVIINDDLSFAKFIKHKTLQILSLTLKLIFFMDINKIYTIIGILHAVYISLKIIKKNSSLKEIIELNTFKTKH